MRRPRRTVPAVLLALLPQLSLLGGGAFCSTPVRAHAATVVVTSSPAHEHGVPTHQDLSRVSDPAHEHDASTHDESSREGGPEHCAMTMSCATMGVLAESSAAMASAPPSPARIAASDEFAPLSFRGEPEPPPPRT